MNTQLKQINIFKKILSCINMKSILIGLFVLGLAGAGYWYWMVERPVYGASGIRLFTASECQKLGGKHYSSGECLKPEGGSFSWDLRKK